VHCTTFPSGSTIGRDTAGGMTGAVLSAVFIGAGARGAFWHPASARAMQTIKIRPMMLSPPSKLGDLT